jgi:hypothetical protein
VFRPTAGVAAAALIIAIAPASSEATVTVGSSLGGMNNAFITSVGSPSVMVQTGIPAAGYRQSSPVDGTVVLWRIRGTHSSGSQNILTLRVLRPSGTEFVGAGSSAPQTLPNGGSDDVLREFTASVPIHIGDQIGLGASANAVVPCTSTATATVARFNDFADGSPSGAPFNTVSGFELQLNAEVEPTNTFSLSHVQAHKKKGTATVTAHLPNAGTFEVQGALINPQAVDLAAAGDVALTLRPTQPIRKRLKKQGKAAVDATFIFTPTFGKHKAESVPFTLKLKRKTKGR